MRKISIGTGVALVAALLGLASGSLGRAAALVAPGAPTGVSATAGNAQASVSFTAPVSDGGSAITGYTATSSPGGLTGTGAGGPITVTGLTNGTAYTFTVTATNATGTSAPSAPSNSVTPAAPDTTPPTISLSAPADGAKLTGTVTLSATASDDVGVTGVTFRFCDSTSAACTPGGTGLAGTSGATWTATVPAGQLTDGHTYTWNATASDGAGKTTTSGTRSFVVDRTVPVLTLPAPLTVEADTHAGATVTYTVSATDNGQPLAPGAITCTPASGTVFPIATTTVNCTTTPDPGGNVATGSFTVTVRDTTPPTLNVPRDTSVYATSVAGIPATAAAVATLLSAANAVDLVDPSPSLTNNAPAVFPYGTTTVTFTATDASGNVSPPKALHVTVVNKPASGGGGGGGGGSNGGSTSAATQPSAVDATPPANPGSVTAKAGPGYVTLSWKLPTAKDFDHVEVFRSGDRGTATPAETRVYSGTGTSFVDRSVKVGTRYRYVIASFDTVGNRSVGAIAVATAKAVMLLAPADGAKVTRLPVLRWKKLASAAYYNVQLYRGATKILSAWPPATSLRLTLAWQYQGKRYALTAGTYHWYLWPGLGARSAGKYGQLMGDSIFTVAKGVTLKGTSQTSAAGTVSKAKLRAKKGYYAWLGWTLGEGIWKPYGPSNRSVRPSVPAKVPASWWSRRAKLLADRLHAKATSGNP